MLNGTILLHYSPFAFKEGMHGRYAYISDSPSLCIDGIQRIREIIKICDLDIPQIIALPDRSSKILAHATSIVLNKPLIDYDLKTIEITNKIKVRDLSFLIGPLANYERTQDNWPDVPDLEWTVIVKNNEKI